MTKTITTTHSNTVTAITPKTIMVFLPALNIEADVLRHANNSTQNARAPVVWDIVTVQIAFQNSDIIATAATFVPQQDIRKDIRTSEDDDFIMLDDDGEDAEEYD